GRENRFGWQRHGVSIHGRCPCRPQSRAASTPRGRDGDSEIPTDSGRTERITEKLHKKCTSGTRDAQDESRSPNPPDEQFRRTCRYRKPCSRIQRTYVRAYSSRFSSAPPPRTGEHISKVARPSKPPSRKPRKNAG